MSKEKKETAKKTVKDWCIVHEPVFRQDAFKKSIAEKQAEYKANGWIRTEHANEISVSGGALIGFLKFHKTV